MKNIENNKLKIKALAAILITSVSINSVLVFAEDNVYKEKGAATEIYVQENESTDICEAENVIFDSIETESENEIVNVYRGDDLYGDNDSFGLAESAVQDYTSDSLTGNIGASDYTRWSKPVYSYLVNADNGFLKLDASNKEVKVSLYSKDFKLQEKDYKTIKAELPLFGGFYAGKDAYYIVYGQANDNSSDSAEVFRVVKYDKSFNKLGSDSLYGANTKKPFEAGSLRMTEYGGYLYIRTCHKMYSNHQANVMIEFNENTMKIVDSFTDVANISVGYVSHSFNQFIMIDDEANIVGYDHGDAYPRAAVLGRYAKKAGLPSFSGSTEYPDGTRPIYDWTYALEFKEASDPSDMFIVNATCAALGDISYSKNNYLASGASGVQDSGYSEENSRNIFVSVINRETLTKEVKWITNYPSSGKTSASAPHLVKISDDKFLLVWNVNSRISNYGSPTKSVGYAFVDGNGNLIGNVKTGTGNISDCEPILVNDSVIWYTYDGSKTHFYQIDAVGTLSEINGSNSKNKLRPAEMVDGVYVIAKGGKLLLSDAQKTAGDKTYKVEYSQKGIVKLSSKGVLSGKKAGNCTIKVTQFGQVAEFAIRVEEAIFDKTLYVNKGEIRRIEIKGISLLAGECKIAKEDKAKISPITGKEAELHGLSDNRIDILGVAYGKTKLSFNAEGKQYKIKLSICDPIIKGKDTVAVGKKLKLKVIKGAPISTGWESSNASVATIDSQGCLEAIAPGQTTVSVSNNGITLTKMISVN